MIGLERWSNYYRDRIDFESGILQAENSLIFQKSIASFRQDIEQAQGIIKRRKNILKLSRSLYKFDHRPLSPPQVSSTRPVSNSFNASLSIAPSSPRQRAFVRLRPTLSRDTGNNVIYLPPVIHVRCIVAKLPALIQRHTTRAHSHTWHLHVLILLILPWRRFPRNAARWWRRRTATYFRAPNFSNGR